MKHLLGTCALWVLLLLLTLEINNAAYNLFLPIFDPATSKLEYGNPIPDLLLLSVNFLTFATAGAIMAWWMKGKILSIAVAMAIGSVGLALEIATSFPWFQLMPSHPTSYDHIVAFIGAATPPIAGASGAYLYCRNNAT